MEKLFEGEKVKLAACCDELEAKARLLAECPPEVPPEVMQKVKEDYLALE